MEEGNVVYMTTLYDPSLFWFLYKKDIPNRNKLGEELKRLFEKCPFTIYANVELEKKVLVNYSDEWLRAELVDIKKTDPTKTEYVCWLLDYGIFIDVKTLYEIPALFKDIQPYARKAKLYGLISVNQLFDFITGEKQDKVLKTWKPGVKACIKDSLIKPGTIQYFIEKYSFNGFSCGTMYFKLSNAGGIFELKDKILAFGFGKYDENEFDIDLLQNKKSELCLKEVYSTALNISAEYGTTICGSKIKSHKNQLKKDSPHKLCDDSDKDFSLHIKNEPAKQSSPITTWGRGKKKNSIKTSSDSDSSILLESLSKTSLDSSISGELVVDRPKSVGRGFSKSPMHEIKIESNVELSKIGIQNPLKKKSSGRGFTNSLQKKKDIIKIETDESNFVDNATDWSGNNLNKSLTKFEHSSNNLSKSDVDNSKENVSSQFEASTSSSNKNIFKREKILDVIGANYHASGEHIISKPSAKSASVDDNTKSQTQNQNFHEVIHPTRPPIETDEKSIFEDINHKQFVVSDTNSKLVPVSKINCPPGKCECDTCDKTFDNRLVFEPYKEQKRVPKQEKIMKPSLLFKNSDSEQTKVIIKSQKGEMSSVTENILAPRILVHSKFIIRPVNNLYYAPFHSDIQKILQCHFEELKRFQKYAWPLIMRGQHVFLIGPKGTGKTMSYIPAICTFVLTDVPGLPEVTGPVAIIICPGVRVAEHIYELVNKLLSPKKSKKIILGVPPYKHQHKLELLKGVDILICTPKTLMLILKEKLISLKRLLYVVLENSKYLFDIFHTEMDTVFKIFDKTLTVRKFGQSIQLIVTSQQWSKSIELLACSLRNTPSICIDAHLEAALYGRADIKIEMIEIPDKAYKIIKILEAQSKVFKSVVIYNEVSEIKQALIYLNTHGINYEFLDGTETIERKRSVNRRWLNSIKGEHFVLVCNDDVLNTDLAITDAFIVIQYSLPLDSWSQFVYRFSSFLDNYSSPLAKNDTKVAKCKMYIFLDGTNTVQFPRMVQFLQRMNCEISDNILSTYNILVENIEEAKKKNNIGICYNLLLFGSCLEIITICKGRHYLYKENDQQLSLPQSGLIKLKILHAVSPVTFYCRLLEHTDAENVTHIIDNTYDSVNSMLIKVMNSEKRKLVLEANVGCMYIIEVNGKFERCKVTEILKKGTLQRASKVAVKLIDIGKKMNVSTSDLYITPDYIRHIPSQAIEVTISDLGPCDRDSSWSERCHIIIQKELEKVEDGTSDCCFVGRIQLQLSTRLYVDNLILKHVVEKKITLNKLNLRNLIIQNRLAESRPNILNKLYSLCKEFNIPLPDYNLPVETCDDDKLLQIKPYWAHLENGDGYNEVYFAAGTDPGQFYVKLYKNYNVLVNLRKEIQEAILKPLYPTNFPIVEGNCYLVKDSVENTYERVILKKLEGNIASCLFVDYGDFISIPKSELKFLPNKYISQLPFQLIECKLYGIKPTGNKWLSSTSDVLYDLSLEPDTDLFRVLYVKAMKHEKPINTGYKKYSVILIDNYDNNKIINNLFVDMNLAFHVSNEPIEVDLDELKPKIDSTNNEIVEMNGLLPEDIENEDEIWDLQMFDRETFLKDLFKIPPNQSSEGSKTKILPNNQIIRNTNNVESLPKKVLPPVDYSTPNIVWQQTDSSIKLKIFITGIIKYDLNIVYNKIFLLNAECEKINEKKEKITYKVNMRLFAAVSTKIKHYILGHHIIVNISKENEENWPRLVATTERMSNIIYNIDAIQVEDSDEDGLPSEEMFRKSKEAAKLDDNGSFKYEFGSDEDYNESDVDSYQSSD